MNKMIRTIKFRGRSRKNGQWIYGFYLQNRGAHFICPDEFAGGRQWDDFEIDINTRGQFTGLVDVMGNEVYEGDIVKIDGDTSLGCRAIVYYEESFNLADKEELDKLRQGSHPYMNDYAHMTYLNNWSGTGLVRVVGNVYDHQELIG